MGYAGDTIGLILSDIVSKSLVWESIQRTPIDLDHIALDQDDIDNTDDVINIYSKINFLDNIFRTILSGF